MFVFEKKKIVRSQGYSARVVLRGKSLAFVIPTKVLDACGLVKDWNYQIGAKFDGEHPVLIVSKCGTPKEVEDYIWELKPNEAPKEGEEISKYRFLLPYSETSEALINKECPVNGFAFDDDFIYFTLSRDFVGRKKSVVAVESEAQEINPNDLDISE